MYIGLHETYTQGSTSGVALRLRLYYIVCTVATDKGMHHRGDRAALAYAKTASSEALARRLSSYSLRSCNADVFVDAYLPMLVCTYDKPSLTSSYEGFSICTPAERRAHDSESGHI
jgi:hypothetical protein